MIVPSNSISTFNLQAGEQLPEDSRVEIPNTLLPIVELGTPHIFISPSITRTPNGSFISASTLYKNNSAGTSSTSICILSKGVWRLKWHACFASNYSAATGVFAVLRLMDTSASSTLVELALFPVMAGYVGTDSLRMLYLREDVALAMAIPGNAATEISSFSISVSGERVL